MSAVVEVDVSEDITDFLLRIRELGEKRDQEDEERTRKLEEDILQGREERQARRERARSLSPAKSSSNAGTPNAISTPLKISMQDDTTKSPSDFQPHVTTSDARVDGAPPSLNRPSKADVSENTAPRSLPQTPSKLAGFSNIPTSNTTVLKRAGTLSWQQRSLQREFAGTRSRPLSEVFVENSVLSSSSGMKPDRLSPNEQSLSRDQIAQSLGSKDPAWFRQTEDRGFGSAALRRNKDHSVSESPASNGRMRLLGLSRDSSLEPEKLSSPPLEIVHSESPSMGGNVLGKSSGINRFSSFAPSSSPAGVLSPIPTLNSQIFQPPSDTNSSFSEDSSVLPRILAMSPSQGRISPERLERPHSPTKGLGGFVQSAMLKRSDSVNKRWSAQAAPRSSRGNSIASNRNGYESSRDVVEMSAYKEPRPRPSSDSSAISTSRPRSSHSAVTVTVLQPRTESDMLISGSPGMSGISKSNVGGEFVKPGLPPLKASISLIEGHKGSNADTFDRPTSPVKKWSPTKASWLENALNKPDSAKPRILPSKKPSWMMDINKAKQQRGSADLGKDVRAVGSIRSPSPGIANRPQSFEALPKRVNSGSAIKPKDANENALVRNDKEEVALLIKHREQFADEDSMARSHEAKIEKITNHEDVAYCPTPPKKSKTRQEPIPECSSPTLKQSSPTPSTAITEGLQARGRLASPSSIKPKPPTPPKKDFRSGLKPRRISNSKEGKEEAEFKNVFGKLKRAHTQNYIAPDELKDNILRGKAGLSTTEGPHKNESRDELKESILKQKEAMKMGMPSGIPKKSRGSASLEDRVSPPPEAIVRRLGLTKSESVLNNPNARSRESGRKAPAKPEGLAEMMSLRNKAKVPLFENQPKTLAGTQPELPVNGKPGDQFSSSLAGLLSRGSSSIASVLKPIGSTSDLIGNFATAAQNHAESDGGLQLTHMTKSRARGPKRRPPQAGGKPNATKDQVKSNSFLEPEPAVSGAAHLRLSTTETPPSPPLARSKMEILPLAKISDHSRKPSQPLPPRKPSVEASLPETPKLCSPKAGSSAKESEAAQTKSPSITIKPKPITNIQAEQISKPLSPPNSPPTNLPQNPFLAGDLMRESSIIRVEKNQPEELEKGAPVLTLEEGNIEKLCPQDSTKCAIAVRGKSPAPDSYLAARARSPLILPNSNDEKSPMQKRGFNSIGERNGLIGLGIQTALKESTVKVPLDMNLSSPLLVSPNSANLPRSPPFPGKKPTSIACCVPSSARKLFDKEDNSQVSQSSDNLRLLASFFGDTLSLNPKIIIDTQSVLASRLENDGSDKIKTLRKQIYLVTGGGRLLPVPSHQEHILFEENLYLCTHVFGTLAGTRITEVYLWIGDGVAQAAAEDAHLFARKVAKENNGKLITLEQGKETSNFFQALGGIVITRRGSGSRGDSPSRTSATYMLCGRRFDGQIAFDEVDFSARNLCSGFPYIISARFGKLYLWKGSGSSADELGCARLIGMDLGLTGEIEEVDEGSEPDAFWESVPDRRPQTIAAREGWAGSHWHLKPACDKYATRLFSVDVEPSRPKSSSSSFMWGRRESTSQEESTSLIAQIREIIPFTQKDVVREGVFVLDAFVEIFLIVSLPPLSLFTSTSNPSAPLRASLAFAQEYAIVSASLEDRPSVPVCAVVFMPALPGDANPGALPEEMRWGFRKWDDRVGIVRCTVLGAGDVGRALGI